jgi:aspartyl-tRNA synthetase
VETTEFTLYHVVDGKFAEVWDLVDFEALVEQIK